MTYRSPSIHSDTAGDSTEGGRSAALWLAGLLVLGAAAAGAWLRWRYATGVGLHVDEFSTLWAATRVLERGAPITPSGVLYTRGLFSSYSIAAVMGLGPDPALAGRMLSVILGVALIGVQFFVGLHSWNARVGLMAAVVLALLPEAIEASGRARFYAPLMLWMLLTIWSAYLLARLPAQASRPRVYWLHAAFAVSFVLALYSQEQTILLYPALLLGLLLWRGWRYFLTPPALAANALCALAVGGRFALEKVGQPGYFDAIQGNIPYLGFFFDFAAKWHAIEQVFVDPVRIPWTIFSLVAIAALLPAVRRHGLTVNRWPDFHQATLFFALPIAAMLLTFVTIVGPDWRHPRYVLIVEPAWLLLSAAGLDWTLGKVLRSSRRQWMGAVAVVAALAFIMWPDAVKSTERTMLGYRQAFDYVAANRQPGDVVISTQAAGCGFVLGAPCDYYAAGNGYEPDVIPHEGRLIDRWSGATLVTNGDDLAGIVADAPRVWFVTDGDRLMRRFDGEFRATVIEQFDIAFEEDRVRALLADGIIELPATDASFQPDAPIPAGPMALTSWATSPPQPGQPLRVQIDWQLPDEDAEDIRVHTSVRLVDAGGLPLANLDGPLANDMIFPREVEGGLMPDIKVLQLPGLDDGLYRIDVVAYDVVTHDPVADPIPLRWFRIGDGAPPEAAIVDATWQNGIRLQGWDGLPAVQIGQPLQVRLVWETIRPLSADLTTFVHLLGPDGALVAQQDKAPYHGFYPTSAWQPGSPVDDGYTLMLPDELAPGEYRIVVGWYDPHSGARAPLAAGGDAFTLAVWDQSGE